MIKPLKLSQKAYETYRQTVKGNTEVTKERAAKKLTRNVELVKTTPQHIHRKWVTFTYVYGNLHIKVRGKTIIEVKNHKGGNGGNNYVKYSRKLRDHLSRELGL